MPLKKKLSKKEGLLSYLKFHQMVVQNRLEKIADFTRLRQIEEFIQLVEAGASLEVLARHPLWSERKIQEMINDR